MEMTNPGKGGKGTEARAKTPEEMKMEAMSNLINSNNEVVDDSDDKAPSFTRIVGIAWVLGLVLIIVGMAVYSFGRVGGTPDPVTPSAAYANPIVQSVINFISQLTGAAGKEVQELLDETAPKLLRGFQGQGK